MCFAVVVVVVVVVAVNIKSESLITFTNSMTSH